MRNAEKFIRIAAKKVSYLVENHKVNQMHKIVISFTLFHTAFCFENIRAPMCVFYCISFRLLSFSVNYLLFHSCFSLSSLSFILSALFSFCVYHSILIYVCKKFTLVLCAITLSIPIHRFVYALCEAIPCGRPRTSFSFIRLVIESNLTDIR